MFDGSASEAFLFPFASFSLPEGRGTAGAGVVRDSALIRVLFLF
jgi:hypothetical protein